MIPRFSSFDFGLTGFAAWFHQDWQYEGAARDLLSRLLGPETDPREVRALRQDASWMRAGLTTGEIETLWEVGTGRNFRFGPDGSWPSGQDWLREIVERCDQWLRARDDWPPRERELTPDLIERVTVEVLALTAAAPERLDPDGAIASALRRCVDTCPPDLALRWVLRAERHWGLPLKKGQYERLVQLGEQFGFGEFVISDLDVYVE
ncbi:hypothetical protein [Micromonospora sp. NPDC049645]|uniref:hypothetical protein n=1 Tax=Micromonospora sp. NPDC049645 TaxID=3155508 RepID=UPI0034227B6C